MRFKLSIIIPCYNCATTLPTAVASCYEQGFAPSEFEIIMVDDASIDHTAKVMDSLSKEHNNIRCYSHENNKGGGAARNSAVLQAHSDVIFCLDSDDILPKGTLRSMYDMLVSKDCDGVGLHHLVSFKGTNTDDIEHVTTFAYAGEQIPLKNLVEHEGPCALRVVCMFTKQAHRDIGGYPESHGFDTQGFAWRFLAHGKIAYVCPGATYLHRVLYHESYYLREYNQGRVNRNMKAILMEHDYLFTPEVRRFVQEWNTRDFTKSLVEEFCSRTPIFIDNVERLLESPPIHRHDIVLNEVVLPRTSLTGVLLRVQTRIRGLWRRYRI